MAISINKFSPRPGLVNKQGRLPDPSELVCVEVPKVFDQCLIKRCLVYDDGPDTKTTDMELRSNPLVNPKRYIQSRDYNLNLVSVDKMPLKTNQDYKKLTITYTISFCADYADENGVTQSELFEINRTDIIGKFYFPDSISQITSDEKDADSKDANILKLEMVAEVLDAKVVEEDGKNYLDVTLGYYITVKGQLIVQLLIPAYDYCPAPSEPCDEEPEVDPCEVFQNAPVPKFYPDQMLNPLFNDDSDSEES